VLRFLAPRKGAEHAGSIAQILRLLNDGVDEYGAPKATEREVKAIAKELIERWHIPIGGSRQKPYGYFLIVTAEDQALAVRPLVNELRSLVRRLRALTGKTETARLWGQLMLDLEEPSPQRTQSAQRGAA